MTARPTQCPACGKQVGCFPPYHYPKDDDMAKCAGYPEECISYLRTEIESIKDRLERHNF